MALSDADCIAWAAAGVYELRAALAERMLEMQPHAGLGVVGHEEHAAKVDAAPERFGDGCVDARSAGYNALVLAADPDAVLERGAMAYEVAAASAAAAAADTVQNAQKSVAPATVGASSSSNLDDRRRRRRCWARRDADALKRVVVTQCDRANLKSRSEAASREYRNRRLVANTTQNKTGNAGQGGYQALHLSCRPAAR